MIIKSVHSIEEIESILKSRVLENIHTSKYVKSKERRFAIVNGEQIHAFSLRYKMFFTQGYTCVSCGKTATHFKLEKSKETEKRYHLNAYSDDGTLFSKDHIIPKSKGGKDVLENMQVMCTICNGLKGNKTEKQRKIIENYRYKCVICGETTDETNSIAIGKANVCNTCFPRLNFDKDTLRLVQLFAFINYRAGEGNFGKNTRYKVRQKFKKVLTIQNDCDIIKTEQNEREETE